ncbi:MAG: SdpI family protein [Flavobacteriales bacterium]
MDEPIIAHFIVGILMLVVPLLAYIFPSRKINYFHGYRTRQSMKSQEAWDAAQKYSRKYMLYSGITALLIQLSTVFFLPELSLLFTISFFVLSLILAIVMVEKKLKMIN